MIFESFVHRVAESQYLDWAETIFAHQSVVQFLKVPAAMLRYRGTGQIPFDVFSRFENSFDIIQSALGNPSTPSPDDVHFVDDHSIDKTNADYLFLSACFFIDQLFYPYTKLSLRPFTPEQCKRMADFIKAVNDYEQASYPPTRIQKNWQRFWSDTGLPKEPRFDCRPSPARHSYIPWKDIPPWIEIDLTSPPAH